MLLCWCPGSLIREVGQNSILLPQCGSLHPARTRTASVRCFGARPESMLPQWRASMCSACHAMLLLPLFTRFHGDMRRKIVLQMSNVVTVARISHEMLPCMCILRSAARVQWAVRASCYFLQVQRLITEGMAMAPT